MRGNEGDTRKARATIRDWHGLVKRLWPECPNELVRNDTALIVRGGSAITRGRLPDAGEFGVRPLEPDGGVRHEPGKPALGTIERCRVYPWTFWTRETSGSQSVSLTQSEGVSQLGRALGER